MHADRGRVVVVIGGLGVAVDGDGEIRRFRAGGDGVEGALRERREGGEFAGEAGGVGELVGKAGVRDVMITGDRLILT